MSNFVKIRATKVFGRNVDHRSSIAFVGSVVVLCALMLLSGWLLGEKNPSRSKNVPFESGIDAFGSCRFFQHTQYCLVAVLFVVFDVECLYIYLWSTAIRQTGWWGMVKMLYFASTMVMGLVYITNRRVFDRSFDFSLS